MNSELIIIGIGSPFGADTLGWQVIEQLGKPAYAQFPHNETVQLLSSDRPGTSLLHTLQQFPKAILVDAILGDGPVGTVMVTDAMSLNRESEQFSSHGFGIAETLQLGQTLGWLPPQLVIVGMVIDRTMKQVPEGQVETLTRAVYLEACRILE